MKKIGEVIGKSIILAYKENVDECFNAFQSENLNPSIQRPSYTPEELKLSSSTRTFINHRSAWMVAAASAEYTLICEADFVPCIGLSDFPVFWPIRDPLAWGYLYQGSPRILSVVGSEHYLRGHCAPTVGYIINRDVAELLLKFFDYEMSKYQGEYYFNFEAHLQWWVMGHGAKAYIPERHYGEHGGEPNPEHARHAKVTRIGRHRADNLAGPLAFLPQYARGSRLRFISERIEGRVYGWARLLTGRWIVDTNVYPRNFRQTLQMQWIGIKRLLSLSRLN